VEVVEQLGDPGSSGGAGGPGGGGAGGARIHQEDQEQQEQLILEEVVEVEQVEEQVNRRRRRIGNRYFKSKKLKSIILSASPGTNTVTTQPCGQDVASFTVSGSLTASKQIL
jgi:hypothetical protein